jgi:hypothetical protein
VHERIYTRAAVVPAAELRVYQPLEAFPAEEMAQWERYIVEGAPRSVRPRYVDVATSERLGFLKPASPEEAYVKVVDGAYFVCPHRTRLRVLAGLLAFRDAAPFEGSEAFVPDGAARRARRELRRIRRQHLGQMAAIMQSPWHVPVRWFVLFEDEDRRIREIQGVHRLSYLTTVRRALRRIERAVPVLRHSELGPIAELVVEVHQWLTGFDTTALLELDYAGLCDLMSWDEMDDDHSAREIGEALKALAAREFTRSAELYQAAVSRSGELRSRESAN